MVLSRVPCCRSCLLCAGLRAQRLCTSGCKACVGGPNSPKSLAKNRSGKRSASIVNADACTPLVDWPEPDAPTFNVSEPLFLMRCASRPPMARGWQLSRREETAQGTPIVLGAICRTFSADRSRRRKSTMALHLETAPRKTHDNFPGPDKPREDGDRATRVETRIHQRQCTQCHRWFWAWDPARSRCFVCDAPPPRELRRILDGIHGTAA